MTYETIDFVKVRIPDCLVKYNKVGAGAGEARLYVGRYTLKDWDDFFGNYKLKCFFDKGSLKQYLQSVQFEYENPSQAYRNCENLSTSWHTYWKELQNLPELVYFNIFRNNDNNNQNIRSRYYIKSTDKIYDFFRRIALPNMSSLIIQKVLVDNELQLWFRLYLNDIGEDLDQEITNAQVGQIEADDTIDHTEKESIIKARRGQGQYRRLIIEKYGRCLISGVNDERCLIASHIKPWVSSSNSERIHRENGLLLSPTFDKLFDKGFISFKNTGKIILSDYFSDDNFRRAGLTGDETVDLQISSEQVLL